MDSDGLGPCFSLGRWCCLCAAKFYSLMVLPMWSQCAKVWWPTKVYGPVTRPVTAMPDPLHYFFTTLCVCVYTYIYYEMYIFTYLVCVCLEVRRQLVQLVLSFHHVGHGMRLGCQSDTKCLYPMRCLTSPVDSYLMGVAGIL